MGNGGDDEVCPYLHLLVALREERNEGSDDALADGEVEGRPMSLHEKEE